MPQEKQRLTFISYSRINKDFALKLAKELKAAGFNIWLDQLDIPTGVRWDDELERALERCEIFMIILTPSSISSENVKDEIGYAIDHKKRILPVLLEETKVPLRLRRFQYVDFTSKNYEEGVVGAKQLLQNLVDTPTVQPSRSAVTKAIQEKETLKEKADVEQKKATRVADEKEKKERLAAEHKEAARVKAEEEARRKEAKRVAAEKAEAERKKASRIATEKAEAEQKEIIRLASEKAEAATAKKPVAGAATAKPSFQDTLKKPIVMYGGIGIIIILFIVILASSLGGGGNTPATATPSPTEPHPTKAPTQKAEPAQTLEPTLVPNTPIPAPPTATPTFVPPVEPFVRIIEITLDDSQNYVVEYETYGYAEALPGMHIHFFFDTVSPDQAGSPGSGPWKIYGGPSPFSQYTAANRPSSAKQMCALVANSNHSVQLDSGNCVDLP